MRIMYTVHRFCAAKKKLAGYWAPDSLTSILFLKSIDVYMEVGDLR